MSRQGRRGRGKRPREEPLTSSLERQDHSPISYQAPSSLGTLAAPQGSNRTTTNSSSSRHHGLAHDMAGEAPRQKIAIPALKSFSGHESQRQFKKGRTPHACDHCRKAKSGCSGEQPCIRCKTAQVSCVYGDGKRDKERKRLTKLSKDATILNQHNADICDALRRIRLDMAMPQDQMRIAIDRVLAMKPPDLSGNDVPALLSRQTSPKADGSSSEEDAEDELESLVSQDIIDVGGRATISNQSSSSVAWAARQHRGQDIPHYAPSPQDFGRTMTLVSYHTEDSDLDFFDASDVQIFDWPDPATADTLVHSYFENIHPSAPLLDRIGFMDRYHTFPRGSNNLSQEDLVFLGTLNMVFATSSVFSNLTKSGLNHHNDHLHYLARAKMLCLDGGLLYENARISTTCALGLLCLYFIATCKLNRAFTFCALAIRHAVRLDLHLRSEEDETKQYYKEHLVQLWWSLYSLECSLNGLTGRPSCISDRDISAPLPKSIVPESLYTHDMFEGIENVLGSGSHTPHSPHQSRGKSRENLHMGHTGSSTNVSLPDYLTNSSTCFMYRIQLCIISHDIATQLYCAATTSTTWPDIQDIIGRIDQSLLSWRSTLPPDFNIDFNMWTEPNWNDPNVLSGMGLAMEICYSRIVLFRPCLCRFDGRIRYLTQRIMDFDQGAVEICLKSAREMITLFSAPARSVQTLYAITPWWNILHYLCEALSVLLLETAFQSQHAPDQAVHTLEDAKKGIRWLSMMAEQSISARKAWEIYDRLIRHVAPMVSWSMFDLPAVAPIPPGYRTATSNHPQATNHDQYQHNIPEHTAWRHEQHSFASFDQNFTAGFTNMPQARMVPNPLDHRTALKHFETMVRLHGQYDDPWQHMFEFSRDVQEIGMVGQQQQHGMGESSGSQMQMQIPLPLPFDPRLGHFDTMADIHGNFN